MPVDVFRPARPSGRLAVVAHGRNGAPDQPQIGPLIAACLARGWGVLAPHLSHSAANAGAGAAGDFTIAGQIGDLGAVLGWARQARADLGWTQGGALMLGHSMGAHAALRLAAAGAAGEVAGVVAVAPVVSGAMLLAARRRMGPQALAALLAEVPGAARDWPAHDLIPLAPRIAVPVAVIVGAEDTITPPADARLLADALPDLVAFDVLAGAHHCPLGADYARSIAAALDRIDGRG
ncbi:MAG: alpha/beta hydrolase [Thermohalobaculum sp.]|nr:alpha/beta hydrolase [Thermohalobaculum sp.]